MVLKFGFLHFEFFVFALKLIFQISDAGLELGYFLFGVFVVLPRSFLDLQPEFGCAARVFLLEHP